jgi:hypothetical protein
MTLYDALKSGGYLDPEYGMVSIYDHKGLPGPNCSNYWLFTAIAATIGGFPYRSSEQCERFYAASQVRPGLILRWPKSPNDVSQQEIVAASALGFPRRIEQYGASNLWCFNAQDPDKFSFNYFYARFLDVVPFIRMMSGYRVTIGLLFWAIAVITTALTSYGNTSEKVYKYMEVEKIKGRHWGTNFTIWIWIWKKLMQRKYPGGPKELFAIYFPAKHPFIDYAPERF